MVGAITFISCNVRGLRDEKKRTRLLNFFSNKKADVLCLQDTHILENDVESWSRKTKGHFLYSAHTNNSRGLITIINTNHTDVETLYKDDRILLTQCIIENENVVVANCYAPAKDENSKIIFLQNLNKVISENVCNSTKVKENSRLIVTGDFNTVSNNELDIISGDPHNDNTINKFNKFMKMNGLFDAWRAFNNEEKEFSWKKPNENISRRIDYILADEYLLSLCSSVSLFHVPCTDHRAVKLECKFSTFPKGPSFYKFNNSLLNDPIFITEMNTFISDQSKRYSDMNAIDKWETMKVKIKQKLIELSKCKNNLILDSQRKLEKKINILEKKLSYNPSDNTIKSELDKHKLELELYLEHKCRGAAVRAKISWIEKGERNTPYFLGLEKTRKQLQTIKSLKTPTGSTNSHIGIAKEISRFFSHLYSEKTKIDQNDLYNFHNDIDVPKLNETDLEGLEKPLTIEEIGKALYKLKNGSSPGLDSLTTEFYKMFWSYLKNDLFNSYLLSHSIGTLSYTQTKGVTTLLYKGKGSDRNDIGNYRPITVGNTDYKIIAKVFAERIKVVLPNIISNTQFGFMKGRNSASLLRQIDDIINLAREHNHIGYLFAIDFQKCFDSVSHPYIIYALKQFGFKNNYISWVKTLIANSKSCVNNGGWLTEFYSIEQGLKQGCPLSPLLYLAVAELLALKIKQSTQIKGLNISNSHPCYKILQYADDTTFFLKDQFDFREILSKIKDFSVCSGLHLNYTKSKLMPISYVTPRLTETHNIEQVKFVKILGVIFKTGEITSNIAENTDNILRRIDQLIKAWSKRDLSVIGKILIVKTFLISQCVYLMQSISIPEPILRKINTKIFSFIWRKKYSENGAYEKIKRNIMCSSLDRGGLEMIDIVQMQDSFLLNWGIKFCEDPLNLNMVFPNIFFKDFDGHYLFESELNQKTLKSIRDQLKSNFWSKVLQAWFRHKNTVNTQTGSNSYIWNNKDFVFKGNTLNLRKWSEKDIRYLHDIEKNGDLVSYDEAKALVGTYPGLLLDYLALKNAYISFKKIQRTTGLKNTGISFKDKLIGRDKFSPRVLRVMIVKETNIQPNGVYFWERHKNITIDGEKWLIARTCTAETRLRVLHWKILHNIYPGNKELKKMKIKQTDICSFCTEVDTIEHFFYECIKVKQLWKDIEHILSTKLNKAIKLTENAIMIGLTYENRAHITRKEVEYINYILLIAKMSIGRFKYGKACNLAHTFESECKLRRIELSNNSRPYT